MPAQVETPRQLGAAGQHPALAGRYLAIADDPRTADLVLGVLDPDRAQREAACLLLGCDAAAVEAHPARLPVASLAVAPDARIDGSPARLGPRLLEQLREGTVVLLDGSQPARDLAGWLAVVAQAQVAWAVEHLSATDEGLTARRVVNGGDAYLVHALDPASPTILLTKGSTPLSAHAGVASGRPDAPVSTLSLAVTEPRVRRAAGAAGGVPIPLPGARIVVAVGRGVGGPAHLGLFRELAAALGAALGASRVVVDQGWLPFGHQVGQTGASVAPELYLGFGISGAVQHIVGMRESRTIVAINTDRHAPLCEVADVVIQADAVEVARALLAEIGSQGDDGA